MSYEIEVLLTIDGEDIVLSLVSLNIVLELVDPVVIVELDGYLGVDTID